MEAHTEGCFVQHLRVVSHGKSEGIRCCVCNPRDAAVVVSTSYAHCVLHAGQLLGACEGRDACKYRGGGVKVLGWVEGTLNLVKWKCFKVNIQERLSLCTEKEKEQIWRGAGGRERKRDERRRETKVVSCDFYLRHITLQETRSNNQTNEA